MHICIYILASSIEMNTWQLLSIVSLRINKSGTKFPSVVSLCYCGVNTAQCGSSLRTTNRDAFFRWLNRHLVRFVLLINYVMNICFVISSCSTKNNKTVPLSEGNSSSRNLFLWIRLQLSTQALCFKIHKSLFPFNRWSLQRWPFWENWWATL